MSSTLMVGSTYEHSKTERRLLSENLKDTHRVNQMRIRLRRRKFLTQDPNQNQDLMVSIPMIRTQTTTP